MSFSNKAKGKEDKREEQEEEPTAKMKEHENDDKDELMEEDEPETVKVEVKSKSPTPTPTKSKKRTASPEEQPASDEEEPPAKKQRTKGRPKDTKNTKDPKDTIKKAAKKESTPKASSKAKEEKAEPKAKATQSKAKGRAKMVIDEDEDEEITAPSASTKSPPAKSEDAEDDPDEVVSEPKAESEDEEEKPEVAAKMRKKVAETLQATSKDLHPDWKAGDPVPYAALCTTFSKIEMTTKRLEIAAHCNRFLQQVLRLTPKDLLPTILLMINKLAADYSGIELGIGESLIMKAIGESTGRSLAVIKKDQNEIGDLGMVAAKSRGNQPTMFKPKALTVRGVHESLIAIAVVEGHGSQGRKVDAIKKILSAADVNSKADKVDITKDRGGPSEAKFIVRTLEGKLRLGLAEKTVLVALAQALVFHEVREKSGKVPSTEALAKGETTLKSVYRFVTFHQGISNPTNINLANCPATKLSSLPSSHTVSPIFMKTANFNLVSLSSPCWPNPPSQSQKSSTVLTAKTSPANTNTTVSVPRSTSSPTILQCSTRRLCRRRERVTRESPTCFRVTLKI